MEKDRHYPHDPPPGIPKVSPEVIKTADFQPAYDFDDDFRQLQRENPHLAHRLFTEAVFRFNNTRDTKLKHAFAEGALYLYRLLSAEAETRYLEKLLPEDPTTDDGVDDEDQPLSA